MTLNAKILLPLLVFSLACGLFVPVSPVDPTLVPAMETSTENARIALFTPTVDIPATQTESAIQLATEIAAYTPTPLPSNTPEPEALVEDEKPAPPPAISPGGNYRLEEEVLIGAYGIRFWHNTDSQIGFEDVVLIEKTGMETIKIEQASAIAPLTGADINNDGYPEVIIESYTGGAHCCIGTKVYSLGENPVLILEKPESNAGGKFQDLDGDKIYEYITYDDIFAYQYCPYSGSAFAKVIMAYDIKQEKYLPASPHFPEAYTDDIKKHTQNANRVAKAGTSENGEWDETTKCSILPMLLDYIYLGDYETARTELDRTYQFNDKKRFWNEVMLIVQDSSLYVMPEE